MAHVLCTTTGLAGILNATLEVARRLEAAGHRVTYAATEDVGETVRANGLRYVQLPTQLLAPAPQLPRLGGALGRVRHKIAEARSARARRRAGVENLGVGAFTDLVESLAPDLVLLDMELHEHIIAARARGVRIALVSPWFSHEKRPGLPPLDSRTVPGRGPRGSRLGLELEWLRARLRRRARIARTWARYFGTDQRGVLLRYADDVGFPRASLRQLDWQTVFTYPDVPTLSLTAREMDFPHAPRPGFTYVGPMVREARSDARVDDDVRAELGRVMDDADRAGQRIVHAAVSSMEPGDASFLSRLVDAVRPRDDWRLVIALGGDARTGVDLPPNVHAFPWVPQLDLLARASCSIHHGGIHTIHECISEGVAMVAASGRRFDQDGCTARLLFHGLARVVDRERADPGELRAAIDAALDDESARQRVTSMQETIDGYARERVLERTVDGLLAT